MTIDEMIEEMRFTTLTKYQVACDKLRSMEARLKAADELASGVYEYLQGMDFEIEEDVALHSLLAKYRNAGKGGK